ncbi:MAG: amidohydrolase family protein [Deltaproteobacteria bacterium]|nr:amidohydrolase family protein [Deltaproteobacteria bacterium]
MKILDSHIHIFNSQIIENVISRTELVKRLCLHTEDVYNRLSSTALLNDMASAGVSAALMLPTSDVGSMVKTNRTCIGLAKGIPELFTAGTLHPDHGNIKEELFYLSGAGVRVIKLCSFSQGFSLDHPKTRDMFERIQDFNNNSRKSFSVVLDTLTLAHQHFGTDPKNTTTPRGLFRLVSSFPGIDFIGAHMGGLDAPFEELSRDLQPLPNLYLDTSNASHTLTTDQFIQMLHTHGPGHILFGTDWPWFIQSNEVELVDILLEKAGFSTPEKEAVFHGNLEKILGVVI